MKIVQIGGSRQGVGKTSIGCALIGALPQYRWMALKISPHGHVAGAAGLLREECSIDSDKDTSRYLAAGARRAWLAEGDVPLDFWQARSGEEGVLVVESNRRIGQGIVPCAFLAVCDGGRDTWKASFAERWSDADVLALTGGAEFAGLREERFEGEIARLGAGTWISDSLVAAVARLLESNR